MTCVQTLQIESKAAINWFTLNEMLANPHKFQAIFLASANMEFKFEIDDITLFDITLFDYTSEYDSLLCKSNLPSLKLGREINIAI